MKKFIKVKMMVIIFIIVAGIGVKSNISVSEAASLAWSSGASAPTYQQPATTRIGEEETVTVYGLDTIEAGASDIRFIQETDESENGSNEFQSIVIPKLMVESDGSNQTLIQVSVLLENGTYVTVKEALFDNNDVPQSDLVVTRAEMVAINNGMMPKEFIVHMLPGNGNSTTEINKIVETGPTLVNFLTVDNKPVRTPGDYYQYYNARVDYMLAGIELNGFNSSNGQTYFVTSNLTIESNQTTGLEVGDIITLTFHLKNNSAYANFLINGGIEVAGLEPIPNSFVSLPEASWVDKLGASNDNYEFKLANVASMPNPTRPTLFSGEEFTFKRSFKIKDDYAKNSIEIKPYLFSEWEEWQTGSISEDAYYFDTSSFLYLGEAPVINAPEAVYYVGDSVNLMNGVSAVEDNGNTMVLNTANTKVTSVIPTVDGKYTTPGTYEVSYQVSDRRGNIGVKTRIIKVNGLPQINATSQVYTIGDANIVASVANNASALWQKAGPVVGTTPQVININGPASTSAGNDKLSYVVSGPSKDFSKVGIYEVTYTATTTDGKAANRTVAVLIKPKKANSDASNMLFMDANNFVVENEDAKMLNGDIAKDNIHGNVLGFITLVDGSNVVSGYKAAAIDAIQVNANELQAIQKAGVNGGIYDLTYTLVQGDKTVSKTIKVLVKPLVYEASMDNNLLVSANDFTMEYKDVKSFDATVAIREGEAVAYQISRDITGTITDFKEVTPITDTNDIAIIYIMKHSYISRANSGGA